MDVNRLIEGFLGSQNAAPQQQTRGAAQRGGQSQSPLDMLRNGLPGGMAGGALAGGALALLLGTKGGRKMGGKALKLGGMAVVGGLAYKAYRDWQANKQPPAPSSRPEIPPPPADSGFDPEHDQDRGGADFRLALMRAMIAAAKSDGHIDSGEHGRIRERIAELDMGAEEKGALLDYFAQPDGAADIAALARTEPQRAELYLVSALAVDPDTPEERRYLEELGRELDIADGLRQHLDAEAAVARHEAGAGV